MGRNAKPGMIALSTDYLHGNRFNYNVDVKTYNSIERQTIQIR